MELEVINGATRRLTTKIVPKPSKSQHSALMSARQGARHRARMLWLVRTVNSDHFDY